MWRRCSIPAFLSRGELHTAFLDEHAIVDHPRRHPGAGDGFGERPRRVEADGRGRSVAGALRLAARACGSTGRWSRSGRAHTASVSAELGGDGVRVVTPGHQSHVGLLGRAGRSHGCLSVDGRAVTVREWDFERRVVELEGRLIVSSGHGCPVSTRPRPGATWPVASGRWFAPMPGRVAGNRRPRRAAGNQHQPLVVLEAMKMEHVIEAPRAGVVTELYVQVGEQVASGAELLSLGSSEGEGETHGRQSPAASFELLRWGHAMGCRTRPRASPPRRRSTFIDRCLDWFSVDRGHVVRSPEGRPFSWPTPTRSSPTFPPGGPATHYSALVPNSRGLERALACAVKTSRCSSRPPKLQPRQLNRSIEQSLEDARLVWKARGWRGSGAAYTRWPSAARTKARSEPR